MGKVVCWLAALVMGVSLLSGCRTTADRAGGPLTPAPVVVSVIDISGQEMQPYQEAVTRLSKGRIVLRGANAKWHLHDPAAEHDAIEAVAHGEAVLGLVPARGYDTVGVTSFDALGAPLLIDSLALEGRVTTSDVATAMLAGVEPLGLTGLAVLPGPLRKPIGLARPLVSAGDYRGARIAVSASVMTERALSALGAVAVPSPFQKTRLSAVDGLEQQVESVAGNEYDAPGSVLTTNVNLFPRPLVLVANTSALAALPSADRQILRQAAAEAQAPTLAMASAGTTGGARILCDRGRTRFVTASSAQIADLRAAVDPVLTALRADAATAQALDQIAALRAGLEDAAQAEAPVCHVAQSATGIPSALNGTYTVITTAADGDPTAENWGSWVYVLDNGRLAFTQDNATACTWGYGTYAVQGAQMVWDMADGGGIAPNGAANQPGEHFVYSWSLFKGVLTLGPPPATASDSDASSPTNFRIRPWHRVTATPTPGLLSRRCPPPAVALAGPTPLEGTWRTTFTKEALIASPLLLNKEEVNDHNWGTITLTFRGALVTDERTNAVTSTRMSGTVTVSGDVLKSAQANGELVAMRWSIENNQLVLRRDSALGVGPTPLVLQSFVRVEDH